MKHTERITTDSIKVAEPKTSQTDLSPFYQKSELVGFDIVTFYSKFDLWCWFRH